MNQINYNTNIKLLKSLFDEELKERKTIGEELHASKVYLNELERILKGLETKVDNEKIDLNIIGNQKHLINEFLKTLKEIRAKLYPPFLPLSGILVGIKQYIVDYPKTEPVDIDFDYDYEERDFFDLIRDIRIYKSCVEIIDFIFLCKAKTLLVKIKSDGKTFEFEVFAELEKPLKVDFDLKKKRNTIKAYLILSEGNILKGTNWKNTFKITFKITK